MSNPLISIIIPIYKVEKYIRQCIDSVLSQEFDDYEIIMVDDGSPDRCPQICDEYAKAHANIKVVHKQNGGLSDARNAGMEVASGEYITFIDSDDFWQGSNVLSEIERIILNYSRPDVIVSDFIKYYEKADKYIHPSVVCSESYNGKSKYELLHYLYFCHADMKMSACQKFTKRELLTCIRFEKGLLSEDIDWSMQVYINARTICVCPIPFYCYRQQREGSITNTASQHSFDSLMFILNKWGHLIPLSENIPDKEKEIYMGYLAYQLSIAMSLYIQLDGAEKESAIASIKSHLYMFSGTLNTKTKRVHWLISLFGVWNACVLLNMFIKLRHKMNTA